VRDTTVVRIGDRWPGEVTWVQMRGTSAEMPSAAARGTLAEAATVCEASRVIVLVPGVDILLTSVSVPTRRRQRIAEAVPYLLEDQLAADVDRIHFALGEHNDRGEISVAVVSTARLEEWLSHLQEYGIRPDQMFPDVLALPYQTGQWTVMLDDDTVLVRSDRQGGFAIELDSAFESIRAALEEAGEERPQRLQVIQCSGDSDVLLEGKDTSPEIDELPKEAADAVLEELGVEPVPVQADTASEEADSDEAPHDEIAEEESKAPADEDGIDYILQSTVCEPPPQLAPLEIEMTSMSYAISPLGLLAQFLEGRNVIDLLQGRYSRREQYGRLWRPWRPAAVLLGVFLVLQVSIMAGRYIYLSGEVRDLRARVVQIYRDAFPDAKNIVNPRVQMERNLKELATSAQGGETFLNLMAQVSQPLKQTTGLQLERLAFNDGYLDLALTVGNLQDLDRLKGALLQRGQLEVEIQSASSRADHVEARVRIGVRGS